MPDTKAAGLPTLAELEQLAEGTFPVIERDWGQPVTGRLRAVLKHWMVRNMQHVRDRTIDQHRADLRGMLEGLDNGRLL